MLASTPSYEQLVRDVRRIRRRRGVKRRGPNISHMMPTSGKGKQRLRRLGSTAFTKYRRS